MSRFLTIAGAQLGPIARKETRSEVMARMTALLQQAKNRGCDLVVFPSSRSRRFFPDGGSTTMRRWTPFSSARCRPTRPSHSSTKRKPRSRLLSRLRGARRRIPLQHIHPVDGSGNIIGKYRKVHLPGHDDNRPDLAFQHLEKRYSTWGISDSLCGALWAGCSE